MVQLSRREREVASLVAENLTNRAIAERLFISERTAEYHVEQLRNKLGFHSRAEVSAWVCEQDQSGRGRLRAGNLPPQLTTFVGRGAELEQVRSLLVRARLVTLTGPGGVGKTRLALKAAATMSWADGAWFVDLGGIAEGGLLWGTIARGLEISPRPDASVTETVCGHLRTKSALILLDNCEHLLPAIAPTAAQLLRSCQQVRLLATCREPLGVDGEITWPVPPLPVPAPLGAETVVGLARSDAVRLFIDRARLARPAFELTSANAAAVGEIARRLDGMPLALELAAARVRAMTPDEILERLHDRFRLLTGGSRTALPRQQTLRATLDWSHALLEPEERMVFARLGVFVGGFTLDSAGQVCGDPTLPPEEVWDVLSRLVDRSMVQRADHSAGSRYLLLDTMRDYALEHAMEDPDLEDVRGRHARCYSALAARSARERDHEGHALWLRRLEAEHENLRAAITWDLVREPDEALGLASDLGWFWDVRGHLTEGRAWLRQSLARSRGHPTSRARACNVLGWLALRQGDLDESTAAFDESLRLVSEGGDHSLEPEVHTNLGQLARARRDHEGARAAFDRALASATELGDEARLADCIFQQALLAYFSGDRATASADAQRCLAIRQRRGDRVGTAYAIGLLGCAAIDEGDLFHARQLLTEAMDVMRELEDQVDVPFGLDVLVRLAVAEGEYGRAVLLAGAAGSRRDATGTANVEPWKKVVDRDLERARRILGEEAAAREWTLGTALTWQEALELGQVDPPPAPVPRAPPWPPGAR
jgi:predicted ATPase/DNA-binding CsgD family transcriptional regulator